MARLLGKLPPRTDARTLLLANYLGARLPAPPARVDYASRVTRWPMYGNDVHLDCTCAAAAHTIQSWTRYARRREVVPPWRAVLAAYYAIAGGRDVGAYCLDVLKFWRTHGIARDRIFAFARLRDGDVVQAKRSIDLFGVAYIGFALPRFALLPRRAWDVPPGGTAAPEARPNPDDGHCVPALAYDATHLYVVTWGRLKAVTWRFYAAYMDEAYAVLGADWASAARRAPSGFGLRALHRDLAAL